MTDPRHLLGMLTPSSNTVLKPMTTAMLAGLPDVTAHFSRFPVTETGIPVSDTVATAVWAALRTVDVPPRRVRGWGRLFDLA